MTFGCMLFTNIFELLSTDVMPLSTSTSDLEKSIAYTACDLVEAVPKNHKFYRSLCSVLRGLVRHLSQVCSTGDLDSDSKHLVRRIMDLLCPNVKLWTRKRPKKGSKADAQTVTNCDICVLSEEIRTVSEFPSFIEQFKLEYYDIATINAISEALKNQTSAASEILYAFCSLVDIHFSRFEVLDEGELYKLARQMFSMIRSMRNVLSHNSFEEIEEVVSSVLAALSVSAGKSLLVVLVEALVLQAKEHVVGDSQDFEKSVDVYIFCASVLLKFSVIRVS